MVAVDVRVEKPRRVKQEGRLDVHLEAPAEPDREVDDRAQRLPVDDERCPPRGRGGRRLEDRQGHPAVVRGEVVLSEGPHQVLVRREGALVREMDLEAHPAGRQQPGAARRLVEEEQVERELVAERERIVLVGASGARRQEERGEQRQRRNRPADPRSQDRRPLISRSRKDRRLGRAEARQEIEARRAALHVGLEVTMRLRGELSVQVVAEKIDDIPAGSHRSSRSLLRHDGHPRPSAPDRKRRTRSRRKSRARCSRDFTAGTLSFKTAAASSLLSPS